MKVKKGTIIGVGVVAACGVAAVLIFRRGKRVQAASGATQTTSGAPAPASSVVDTFTRGLKALGADLGVSETYNLDSAGQPIVGHYESPSTFAQRAVSGLYAGASNGFSK